MFHIMQITSIVLVSVGLALSLAHALELPGKLRLPRETYLAVQSIYYPGFTIGGAFGEFGAILATLVLLTLTPRGSAAFWLTLAALVALAIMHALYWTLTHPVNKVWLESQPLDAAGTAFFRAGGAYGRRPSLERDWTTLRDRWEWSHVARAVFALASLISLAAATAVD